MTTMAPIRVAAVGLGWVTLQRHIPAILKEPAFRLAGVVSRRPSIASETARRLGIESGAETYDLDRIAWMEGVDAIAVGATPDKHAALAEKALAMGKHVLVEKPFAMSVAEGERMAAAARANGRVLAVVHNFLFCRSIQKLARDLSLGRLGTLNRVAVFHGRSPRRRAKAWTGRMPLGVFYDESPHFFYLLRALAGGKLFMQHAYGVASPDRDDPTPRLVGALYRNGDGVPFTFESQYDSALSEWHVAAAGEDGVAFADLYRDFYVRLPHDGAHDAARVLRTSVYAFTQHIFQYISNGAARLRGHMDYGNGEVFRRFARGIRGDDQALVGMSGDDALAILKMQHEAVESVRSHWYA